MTEIKVYEELQKSLDKALQKAIQINDFEMEDAIIHFNNSIWEDKE